MKDYYNILGLDQDSSIDEIKRAYRKKAKLFHPDANKTDVDTSSDFKLIKEAYDTLRDTRLRNEYDHRLRDSIVSEGENSGYNNSFDEYDDFNDINQNSQDYSHRDEEFFNNHSFKSRRTNKSKEGMGAAIYFLFIGLLLLSIKNLFFTPAYVVGDYWWIWIFVGGLSFFILNNEVKKSRKQNE